MHVKRMPLAASLRTDSTAARWEKRDQSGGHSDDPVGRRWTPGPA